MKTMSKLISVLVVLFVLTGCATPMMVQTQSMNIPSAPGDYVTYVAGPCSPVEGASCISAVTYAHRDSQGNVTVQPVVDGAAPHVATRYIPSIIEGAAKLGAAAMERDAMRYSAKQYYNAQKTWAERYNWTGEYQADQYLEGVKYQTDHGGGTGSSGNRSHGPSGRRITW